MQFLKTLFWVILVVALVLFAEANWNMVTIDLWGNLQADVKLPVLVIGAFLLGFVPTFIIYRARIWSLRRRLEAQSQVHVANVPGAGPAGTAGAGSSGAPDTVRPAPPLGTERPVA